MTRLMIIATPITPPSTGEPNHSRASAPMTTAKQTPLISPTDSSRRMMRQTLLEVRSLVARERTATVSACVPALPPIEATIGISTASATTVASTSSNCAMTNEASTAVARFTASHGRRCRTVSTVPSESRLSSPTPARRRMSSSCSSSSTDMASSMVITPTSRSLSSTTGAEIRWYWLKA